MSCQAAPPRRAMPLKFEYPHTPGSGVSMPFRALLNAVLAPGLGPAVVGESPGVPRDFALTTPINTAHPILQIVRNRNPNRTRNPLLLKHHRQPPPAAEDVLRQQPVHSQPLASLHFAAPCSRSVHVQVWIPVSESYSYPSSCRVGACTCLHPRGSSCSRTAPRHSLKRRILTTETRRRLITKARKLESTKDGG